MLEVSQNLLVNAIKHAMNLLVSGSSVAKVASRVAEILEQSYRVVGLRFSRSFPEALPLMALYRLYRGVDAHVVAQGFGLALAAPLTQFDAINISGETPFVESDCDQLFTNLPEVLNKRVPAPGDESHKRQWPLPECIDRVYVIEKAKTLIGYRPQFGFPELLYGR